jgi:hypothetical protein
MTLAYAGHRHRTKRSRDMPLLGLRGIEGYLARFEDVERFYIEIAKKQGLNWDLNPGPLTYETLTQSKNFL